MPLNSSSSLPQTIDESGLQTFIQRQSNLPGVNTKGSCDSCGILSKLIKSTDWWTRHSTQIPWNTITGGDATVEFILDLCRQQLQLQDQDQHNQHNGESTKSQSSSTFNVLVLISAEHSTFFTNGYNFRHCTNLDRPPALPQCWANHCHPEPRQNQQQQLWRYQDEY